jgi:hypothetical protein
MALSIISRYCTLVLEVELTVDDELKPCMKSITKTMKFWFPHYFGFLVKVTIVVQAC